MLSSRNRRSSPEAGDFAAACGSDQRQVPGMYLPGVPAQDHVSVPVAVFAVGVTVRVTATPVEVLAVLPLTEMMPVSLTLAGATLPVTATVTPLPMDLLLSGSARNLIRNCCLRARSCADESRHLGSNLIVPIRG